MNLVFIMYLSGAKGKFITELCDLLMHPPRDIGYVTKHFFNNSGGNVNWNYKLLSNKYFDLYPNGVFPEEINYTEYVSQIEDSCKSAGLESLCIDTHYQLPKTVQYLLDRNYKVIRIYTTTEDGPILQNNFFFKNFIYDLTKTRSINDTIKYSLQCAKVAIETANKLEEFKYDLNIPLHNWSKERLKSLFNIIGHFTGGHMHEIEDKENLMNLKFTDINNIDNLLPIANFLGVEVNDNFLNRCDMYFKKQNQIQQFDEYVETFLKINQEMEGSTG